jgi:hypothetical protein
MPITNYVRPQLTIEQLLAELPAPSVDRLVPIVIGPQYLLSRYGKEETYGVAFDADGQTIPYNYYDEADILRSLPATYTPELDTAKLYGVGLEASLATFYAAAQQGGAGEEFTIESLLAANVIQIDSDLVKTTGDVGALHAGLFGRNVAVGDLVYVKESDGATTAKRRVVTGFRGVAVPAVRGSATNSSYNPATDASADATTVVSKPSSDWSVTTSGDLSVNVLGGSVLATKLGEQFTITVRTPGDPAVATVDISSKSGNYSATNVATADDGSDGYDITDTAAGGELAGIDVNLSGGTLTTGQRFIINVYQGYTRANAGSNKQFVAAGTYTGTKDTTYLVKVKTGTVGDTAVGGVLEITDTAGVDAPSEVEVSDDGANGIFDVGTYGITLTVDYNTTGFDLEQGGLVAGDVYFVTCTAARESTTQFDKIVLDGPAVDTTTFADATDPIHVEFRKSFTGLIAVDDAADTTAWEATTSGLVVDAALAMHLPERTLNEWATYVDGVGYLHASYKAIVPAPASEDKIGIETVSDITSYLGVIDLDNDLAFGVNEALSGVQGAKKVWALRTAGTELADFTAALKKIESTDKLYALCPLTDDLTIQKAVASHCEAMSAKTKKNFRRCYVGTDSPGEYAVLSVKEDTTNYTATIGDYGGANVLLSTEDDVDFRTLGLETGDLVKLTATDEEYEISSILTATEIVLVEGPVAPVSPAVPFQLWRANTPSSQVDFVRQRSLALSSRRCANVWVENATRLVDGSARVIPNKFVAAEVAGLRCAVLPQQGLTNTEIQSVTDASSMYIRYTQDELDEVAAAGTFVITQEAESGLVFIRHQLTTESSRGSMYYEDSVGVNLDNISFQTKDALDGFIGKKNVTAKTLIEIKMALLDILVPATKVPADVSYGPALNGFEDLTIAVHPTLKDRVTVYARLLIPLPLNNIDVTLEGDVDLSL